MRIKKIVATLLLFFSIHTGTANCISDWVYFGIGSVASASLVGFGIMMEKEEERIEKEVNDLWVKLQGVKDEEAREYFEKRLKKLSEEWESKTFRKTLCFIGALFSGAFTCYKGFQLLFGVRDGTAVLDISRVGGNTIVVRRRVKEGEQNWVVLTKEQGGTYKCVEFSVLDRETAKDKKLDYYLQCLITKNYKKQAQGANKTLVDSVNKKWLPLNKEEREAAFPEGVDFFERCSKAKLIFDSQEESEERKSFKGLDEVVVTMDDACNCFDVLRDELEKDHKNLKIRYVGHLQVSEQEGE